MPGQPDNPVPEGEPLTSNPDLDEAGYAGEPGGSSGGLCWSFELDLAGVLAAIGAAGGADPGDQEGLLAEELECVGAGPGRDLTGVVAEYLPAGPGLAAWLGNAEGRSPSGEEAAQEGRGARQVLGDG